ncbi:MAG: serine hydrolase [Acidobacteria bacterium]|nr:serine hydrolase [Acidobacteriota bacterium]
MRLRRLAALVATGALIVPGVAAAQATLGDQLAGKFQRTLDQLAASARGVVGISVVDVTSGRRWDVNGTTVFPQGSAIKVSLLLELFRRADAKELALTDRVTLTAADKTGGSSLLQYFADGGSAFSLHDLAVPMIVLSDNTATNMLIDAVGLEKVNATMATLGLPNTRFRRKMIRPEDQAAGRENISTPREAADLMARLSRCDVPLTAASCAEVTRLLELPKSGAFREPIPGTVRVAWKPGSLDGVSTAWGLVAVDGAPYAIAVMVTYGDATAPDVVREASAAAYTYFTQIAGATSLGARVPPALVKKPGR